MIVATATLDHRDRAGRCVGGGEGIVARTQHHVHHLHIGVGDARIVGHHGGRLRGADIDLLRRTKMQTGNIAEIGQHHSAHRLLIARRDAAGDRRRSQHARIAAIAVIVEQVERIVLRGLVVDRGDDRQWRTDLGRQHHTGMQADIGIGHQIAFDQHRPLNVRQRVRLCREGIKWLPNRGSHSAGGRDLDDERRGPVAGGERHLRRATDHREARVGRIGCRERYPAGCQQADRHWRNRRFGQLQRVGRRLARSQGQTTHRRADGHRHTAVRQHKSGRWRRGGIGVNARDGRTCNGCADRHRLIGLNQRHRASRHLDGERRAPIRRIERDGVGGGIELPGLRCIGRRQHQPRHRRAQSHRHHFARRRRLAECDGVGGARTPYNHRRIGLRLRNGHCRSAGMDQGDVHVRNLQIIERGVGALDRLAEDNRLLWLGQAVRHRAHVNRLDAAPGIGTGCGCGIKSEHQCLREIHAIG